jgi:diguanylate cyclase (GGDEF)-like protein
MYSQSSDLLRLDPLTGCKNFLGFLESCMEPSPERAVEHPYSGLKISSNLVINGFQYSAALFVWMKDMGYLNETRGYSHGNSAIRWMGILLREETGQLVYRLWGIEFAVFLKLENEQAHTQLLERVLERMNREAELLGFPGAPADVALILNDQPSTCLDSLLVQMGEAMGKVKNSQNLHHMVFHASDFDIPACAPQGWAQASHSTVRWIARASIFHVIEMGKNLDLAQQDAYTDLISNLPNLRAALVSMEETLQDAREKRRPFSILMIDGDNIRAYNSINYAAGDEMIRQMSAVLKQNLRPDDFVARWRSGDEFIITLPGITAEEAAHVGERFRLAVKNASQAWRFPVSISIGVAGYPANGEDIDTLIDKVEAANKRAKQQGKDQVVLAE